MYAFRSSGPEPSRRRWHPFLDDERYLEARGHRLRVSVEGTGPPLLLINGLAANIELWRPLRDLLPARQTIAFDPPGIGGSPASPDQLWLTDLADIVDGLLSQVAYDGVDVLGYSFGGALAQQLARQHPQRVRRLVLAATIPGLGVDAVGAARDATAGAGSDGRGRSSDGWAGLAGCQNSCRNRTDAPITAAEQGGRDPPAAGHDGVEQHPMAPHDPRANLGARSGCRPDRATGQRTHLNVSASSAHRASGARCRASVPDRSG